MGDVSRDERERHVERRARALYTLEHVRRGLSWEGATDFTKNRYKERARATMEADRAAGMDPFDLRERKDGAYEERNRVVAALARLFPSGLAKTDIPGWDAEWHGCVYIDTPAGQLSWHFHDSQAHLFDGLPEYQGEWDGHDTPEKYRRVAALDGGKLLDVVNAARTLMSEDELPSNVEALIDALRALDGGTG